MLPIDYEKLVSSTNKFIAEIASRDAVNLGPEYSLLPDTSFVETQLALYRMKKKFQEPKAGVDLAEKSVREALQYDSTGFKTFEPALMHDLDPDVRKSLYKLRVILHENFRNIRLSHLDMVLPSGETCTSKRGDVSVYAKLADPRQWCVTADCFEYAAGIIYRTRWLKHVAKGHMPKYTRQDNRRLFDALACPFEIFKCKLLDFVNIVDGSRITTVPKNNDTDRVINCEPLLNMVCQLTLSQSIRRVLVNAYGVDLRVAQDIHKQRISDLSQATIDLSNASNSNWMSVIRFLYPKRILRYLEDMRSPFGTYKGETHEWNMLSPMGNGFTFEVMTATLLSAARLYDEHSTVFGDDIIINSAFADRYIQLLNTLGYQINVSKTFTSGYFRESCGGFFHKDRYLKSYDFWWCEDILDAIVSVNKLIELRDVLQISEPLKKWIKDEWPPLLLREATGLDGCVNIPPSFFNVKRFKRGCSEWTRMIPLYMRQCRKDIDRYTYDHRKVDFYVNLSKESMTYITLGKWKSLPLSNVRNKALIGSYLYSGMCTAPVMRNKTRIKRRLVVY